MALVSDSVKVKHVPAMISWSRCHELMRELQNGAVDNIDYAIALSAIMEDMHMHLKKGVTDISIMQKYVEKFHCWAVLNRKRSSM